MQSEILLHRDTGVANKRAPDDFRTNYDPDLRRRIEANFLDLCKCGLSVSYALMETDEDSLGQHFRQYENAIRKHLQLISIELYVYLRNTLPDGEERTQVTELEAKANALCHRLVDILASFELTARLHPEVRDRALSGITRTLENNFMRETEVLFPIYRRIA